MRRYAVGGLCLVGGIAWAVLLVAPAAKLTITSSPAAPPAVVAPGAQSAAKPADLPARQIAIQSDAEIAAQSAALADIKSGEEITANIKAAAATEPAAKAADAPAGHVAIQSDAEIAAQSAALADIKSGEEITAEIKAAAAAEPTAAAQADVTGSNGKPIVEAAPHPDVKTDDLANPPAAAPEAKPEVPALQPDANPTETPAAAPAAPQAERCPGHPDALGTSRVITVTPGEFNLLGTIQYKQTLPLKDHEVVLTFDDGPIPPYTNSILDTLAANCVKATYFLVGEMAQARPYLVRRIYNEGHTIGTHSQTHPFGFEHLSMDRVVRQVNGGIESVKTALGDPEALSFFFRIPGFGRTTTIEHFLESEKLVTWSADVDTDDWWRGSTPSAIVQRAMRRLNAKGRGIILMHDIHPATALALPMFLKELKANGYHVVQVVAAGDRPKSLPEVAATPLEKQAWPRVSRVSADKDEPAKVRLRHRFKHALAHGRSRRRSARKARPAKSTTATPAPWRNG